MNVKRVLVLLALLTCSIGLLAQDQKDVIDETKEDDLSKARAGAKDKWEVGIHGGYFFVAGDVGSKPGYGGGVHVRKALDYIFSIRADLLAGFANGEGTNGADQYSNTWYSGSILGIISLNTLRMNQPNRKINMYAMLGGGANYFEVLNQRDLPITAAELAFNIDLGAGIAYKINENINIALEHKAGMILGNRSDLVDGRNTSNGQRSPFRDIVNYTSIRVNFNIGGDNEKEPLYWRNPLDVVLGEVKNSRAKTIEASVDDADNDGVLDAFDEDPNTPPNTLVDTKGRPIDTDQDGIPDYKDKQPFSPKGKDNDGDGVVDVYDFPQAVAGGSSGVAGTGTPGGTVAPGGNTGGGVSESRVRDIVNEEINKWAQTNGQPGTAGANGGAGINGSASNWFLPMIHFRADSDVIKYEDYGTLASIGRVLQNNPGLRLVVTGYTDTSHTDDYNNKLSYTRAENVINHLVDRYSIPRERFVLHWEGENSDLNGPTGSSYMNRRVEFRAATNETDMPPPGQINSSPRVAPTKFK